MIWLLGLGGPLAFGTAVFAQQTGGGTSLTEALVAFGVITGLSGAVVKLWAENQRLITKIEEAATKATDKTLPALGEAIAELRETRREREQMAKVLERTVRVLDRIDPPAGRRRSP